MAADTTPSEVIRTRRLEAARERLLDPHLARTGIAEIARRSGFSSMTTFANAFRAHYGQSARRRRVEPRTLDTSQKVD
ncbi:MAG TPA: helix-turn-helix domain-containing protein [Pseudonocardiaceae bacterium]|jgi:AraC-like DNA-binding protein|nr:helix-turn-helix domain-containing protein [Pseudonocardiaceae bacterium]